MVLAMAEKSGRCTVAIRVVPGAGRDSIQVTDDGSLKVRVRAQARKGAANRRVIRLLARTVLRIPSGQLRIVWGEKSRSKVVQVEMCAAHVNARLRAAGLEGAFARERSGD